MADFVDSILKVFDEVFAPLINALKDPQQLADLLAELGWAVDPALVTGPSTGLAPVTAPFTAVESAFTTLSTDIQNNDYASVPEDVAHLIAAIEAVVAPSGLTGLLQPFSAPSFWDALPGQLYPYLLYTFLQSYAQVPFGILRFLGVLQAEPMPANATATPPTIAYTKYTVTWDNLYAGVTAPQAILPAVYGWGSSQFDHAALLGAAADLFGLLPIFHFLPGFPAVIQASSTILDLFYAAGSVPADGIELLSIAPPFFISAGSPVIPAGKIALIALPIPASASSPGGAPTGIALFPLLTGGLGTSFNVTDDVTITLNGDFQTIPVVVEIQPGPVVTVNQELSTSTTLDAEARLDAKAPDAAAPWILFGSTDSSYVSFSHAHFRLVASGPVTDLTYTIEAGLDNAQLVIQFADADSFISEFFSAEQQTFPFTASLTWSNKTGFGFNGQRNFMLDVPVHMTLLNVLTITDVCLSVGPAPGNAKGIAIPLAVSGSFILGPLVVSARQVGLAVDLTDHQNDHTGSFADIDVQLNFKPPDGLGLALDAPPVSGTGFLSYSAADGRYLGAVALMAGDVAISAVGVLDTKLPGGASGYSLLIVASATFLPIEIGFGFSLSGIGGLVGVNRTANVPSLQALARAGRLDDLMFPADLLHRAPQVAANLAQQFPAAPGHFIVGPAAQIQWGTGGMIYADVGVFIELTDSGGGINVLRIALLGLVHLTLPTATAPVADITLDVLGVLDFAAQTLSLDAGLRNSTIATFPLTGQAALRAGWGSNPEFLFAIGGFNPHFQAPAGFPALQRIGLAIGGDNPRLRLSAYLAVTSNTLQLGCAADLYAAVSVAGVTAAVQASLTFDALVQFKPFGLIVDLTIAAAILVNNSPILTLSLDLHVTGPQPWTVTGSASFGFLFLSITVPISITAGPAAPPQSPQTVDLDGNLITALSDLHSWATGPPAGRGLVHVRSQSAAQPAMHPLGTVTVRQHAVPLAQQVDRYGADLLDTPCQYTITGTELGGQAAANSPVTDFFAPAQFLTMTDAQKLSAPSFQTMTAGTALGTSQLTVPSSAGAVADTQSTAAWDTLVLDSPDPPASGTGAQPGVVATSGQASVPDTVLANQLTGASIAVNGPSGRGQARYAAPGSGIGVEEPTYAVVGMNLRAPGTTAAITTLRIGSIAAGQVVAATVGDAQNTQVVYTSEVPS